MNKLSSGQELCSVSAREPEVFSELQSLRCAVNRIDGLVKSLSEKLQVVSRQPVPTCSEAQKEQLIGAPLARDINGIKAAAIDAEQTIEDIISRLEI